MTFSTEIKNEITRLECSKTESIAELSAIVRNSASTSESIYINVENNAVARRIYKLFKDIYNITPTITIRKRYFNKGINYILEIKKNNMLLGLQEVKGEGLLIKLADNNTGILKNGSEALDPSSQIVHYDDLIEVINALNNSGAEAISVNGQRIVQTTAITCEGNVIKINGQKVSSPFTIKAIGSQGLLYGSLTMIGGYLYILDEAGVIVETTQSDNLTVEKYTGVISYKYVKNEK